MTQELIEWGRICICIWTLSLTWICRLFCGIPNAQNGDACLPTDPSLSLGDFTVDWMVDPNQGILVCCFWGVSSEPVENSSVTQQDLVQLRVEVRIISAFLRAF